VSKKELAAHLAGSVMRRVDLHCYPGTQEWVASQGPYVEALGQYWGKQWVGKSEDDVVADVSAAGSRRCWSPSTSSQ
jgi:hypothetical protein